MDNIKELDKGFERLIQKFSEKKKQLVKIEGEKLLKKVLENIEITTKENTEDLKEGVELFIGSNGGYASVRPNAKVAAYTNLVENGYQTETEDGIRWVPGKHMYRNALEGMEDEIVKDAENMIEEVFRDFG